MNIYKQKDGRKFIVYKGEDNKYHSKAYARYLMEQHLGRKLTNEEEVHHKDHNKMNDAIEACYTKIDNIFFVILLFIIVQIFMRENIFQN